MNIRAILTDIEGTTSSIDFVHTVLFPYARKALPEFVRAHHAEAPVEKILEDVRIEASEADASIDRLTEILLCWIDADRKATPLKALQGHIWRSGYERGDFQGHVYAEVAGQLQKWSATGIALYVYSSGSSAAQKLLFGHSIAGDLRSLFSGFFDTRVGHKKDALSYQTIVDFINVPADEVLFLSDIVEELDAARYAGMRTMQLVRDDDVITGSHPVASSFNDITLVS